MTGDVYINETLFNQIKTVQRSTINKNNRIKILNSEGLFHQFYHLNHFSHWVMIITWLCSNKTIGQNHESIENMNLFRPDSDPCHVAISSEKHLPCMRDLLLYSGFTAHFSCSQAGISTEKEKPDWQCFPLQLASTTSGLSLRGCVAFKTRNLRWCVWQNLWRSRNSCFSMYRINKLILYYIIKHSNIF